MGNSLQKRALTAKEQEKLGYAAGFLYTFFIEHSLKDSATRPCIGHLKVPAGVVISLDTTPRNIVTKETPGARIMPFPELVLSNTDFHEFVKKTEQKINWNWTIINRYNFFQPSSVVDKLAETIKNDLECKERFFYLSVGVIWFGGDAHQNILIFDKEKKECIVIEPQIRVEIHMDTYRKLLNRLGLSDYTLVEPPEQCPQYVADDRNCMFWSLLLLMLYLKGGRKSIHEVSSDVFKKYPKREALIGLIEGFKYKLYQEIPAIMERAKEGDPSNYDRFKSFAEIVDRSYGGKRKTRKHTRRPKHTRRVRRNSCV